MNSESKHCMGRLCVGMVLIWATVGVASDLPDHLVLYQDFDEGGIETIADLSGYHNDAVIEGFAAYEDSQYGKALILDGTTVAATVPAFDSLTSLKAPMTVGALFQSVSLPDGYRKMLGMYGTPGARGTGWAFEFNGRDFNFVLFGKKNYWGPVLTVGEWVYIIAVFDGDTVVYYVNGEAMAPIDAEGHDTDVSQSPGLWLGAEAGTLGAQAVDMIVDEVWISNKALSADEVSAVMQGQWRPDLYLASNPSPEDQATEVLRDTILRWTAGVTAQDHHVYLGTDSDDVNEASLTDTLGLPVAESTSSSQFDPGRLDFSTDYFWRVDEVNGAPDFTAFKGKVWSFATERLAYPVVPVAAKASSVYSPTMVPEKTIDGSGLDALDQHDTVVDDMWLTAITDTERWIQYEFAKAQKLHEMWVWNSNQSIEPLLGFGAKDVTIETSMNGVTWTALADVSEFAQASGLPDYTHNTVVDFGGVTAQSIKLTINANWGTLPQSGLSEVRFFAMPVNAADPQPADGSTTDSVDVTVQWRPGRGAARHEVVLSPDLAAVEDGSAAVGTTQENTFGPESLDLDTTYYWQIIEVNEAEVPARFAGDIWSFLTPEYLVVDDFESYDNDENVIYETWIDGWFNETGSTVGYLEEPFAERTIVHEGKQSMPFFYDNTSAATSEADLALAGQDWTQAGITTLTLYFQGDSDNGGGQLYAKINGVKVTYDGGADALTNVLWQPWNIDLASVGANLGNVTTLLVGVEGGGSGVVYVDDIRLYRSTPGN
jgi:Concanavalin A-like lectin/glucanases superfamily/F5/8 type C domain